MQRADRRTMRFVRALLAGDEATRALSGHFVARDADRKATLGETMVRELIAQGVLEGDGNICRATREARSWLKRQMVESDGFAAQHRTEAQSPGGPVLNLDESPLGRLAVASRGEAAPFLERHQVEAGERVRRLAERARLQPRLTMDYSGAHTASRGTSRGGAEIGDLAADARRALAGIHLVLPRDCAGVVLDVCGLLKGLQTVESERGWPRRSAKLVLRIGLEQLAQHFGLAPVAVGVASGRRRAWMGKGARPKRFE
ncbi:MAG: DUF6456 domain-containing protein [Devosia sp.]